MRLTVGPLPAAVYWRRRVGVLLAVAMVVLVISYACGSAQGPTAGAGTHPTPTPTPTPTPSLLHPSTGTPKPQQSAFTLSVGVATGPCTDSEMQVTAAAATSTVQRGQPVDVTITIKNVSRRTCARDIGADMQELRLLDGTTLVWSSDDCNANRGHNMQSFGPGRQVSYTLTWNGRRSRTGVGEKTCDANADAPDVAQYQLVARLDLKMSTPFALRVRAEASKP
jgi:hypothetical protein